MSDKRAQAEAVLKEHKDELYKIEIGVIVYGSYWTGKSRVEELKKMIAKIENDLANWEDENIKSRKMKKEIDKLKNSFNSLANEYRVSEEWREHFYLLFDELSEIIKIYTSE